MLYYGCIRASLQDKYFVDLVLCLRHDAVQVFFQSVDILYEITGRQNKWLGENVVTKSKIGWDRSQVHNSRVWTNTSNNTSHSPLTSCMGVTS